METTAAEETAGNAHPVRVGMIGEGTYPMVMGGVSTWYDQLVTGLDDHEFAIVTVVGEERTPCWDMPENVTSLTTVPMWDPAPRGRLRGRRREARRVQKLLSQLWRAALPAGGGEPDVEGGIAALRELALSGSGHRLAGTLTRTNSVGAILAAWSGYQQQPDAPPPLTLSQAAEVAHHADRMIAVIDSPLPEMDVIHVSSNGPSALLGLARYWSAGTPLILTEHGVYLRERYLALASMDWPVRAALMSLTRLICQITYAEAAVLAPVSEFNAKWSRKLGADVERISTVHNGVDVTEYTPIQTEPADPTVSFVGRIDPLKDLNTMIRAFALVVQEIPDAKLRLFGPIPEQNVDYHAQLLDLVSALELDDAVTFEGRVPNARVAAEAGHVVALSSISEGLPFTVIEAMMCSRATVSTDVGGVKEIVGTDSVAGMLVPPRDPAAMAESLVVLLGDATLRRQMGRDARTRAEDMFGLDLFYRRIRAIYSGLSTQTHAIPPPRDWSAEGLDALWDAGTADFPAHPHLSKVLCHPAPDRVPDDMVDAFASSTMSARVGE